MTSPIPGLTGPNPRTWSPDDTITAARLRGDMMNLAGLFAGGARPMFTGLFNGGLTPNVATKTFIPLYSLAVAMNSWNVTLPFTSGANHNFQVPFAGWYLMQASSAIITGAGSNQFRYATGFSVIQNGSASRDFEGGSYAADDVTDDIAGGAALELFQFNTFANTGDAMATWVLTNDTNPQGLAQAQIMYEWVGLPSFALTSYTGPYGTVVNPPVAAAAFPSGQGTTITNGGGISAGATSMTVKDATGMITGGTLGLDYINSQLYQPYAEAVTITSVAGTTIGISATAFSHAQGAPVAVPVSAAFLNQQCRDLINFLAFPPLLKAYASTTQSIASTGFPPTVGGNPGNQIIHLAAVSTGDNFSGFASNAYTVQVAGAYLVYGQVPYSGSSSVSDYSCGISVNGGTIQWGTITRSAGNSQIMTPTFRRLMRFNAQDAVTLWGFQSSGAGVNTANSTTVFAKLILLFRAF